MRVLWLWKILKCRFAPRKMSFFFFYHKSFLCISKVDLQDYLSAWWVCSLANQMAATPRISSCNLHRFKLHFCSQCFISLLCFYSSTTLLIVRFHKVCVALSLQMMVATLQCALLVVYKLNNRCQMTHHHRLWKRLLDCSLAERYSLFKSWFQNWIPGGKFHTLFNYSQLITNGTILLGCWCWSSELRSVQVTSWWEKAVLYFFYLLYASGAFPGI